jgi:hypothetical protein
MRAPVIPLLRLAVVSLLSAACAPRADLGSDLLWVSTFEVGTFDEWSSQPGGAATSDPSPNAIEISSEQAHRGRYSAKLTIVASSGGAQVNTGLVRRGNLPQSAYYSAWYYVPRTVDVGTFWTIFKIRRRSVVDDPTTEDELFDVDIKSLSSGEMAVHVYDHRVAGDLPLVAAAPVVPVSRWFQIEAYYHNMQDNTGRLTCWLDGSVFLDVEGTPLGPTPWVEWDAVNVGANLSPNPVTLFIDDAAISDTRVTPAGVLD